MQVDSGYKPLQVNLREVAQGSGYVNGALQVLRAGSQFDRVTPIGLL